MEVPKFLLHADASDLYKSLIEVFDKDQAKETMTNVLASTASAEEVQALTDVVVHGVKDLDRVTKAITVAEAMQMNKKLCQYLYRQLTEVPEQHPQASEYGVLITSKMDEIKNYKYVTADVFTQLTDDEKKTVHMIACRKEEDIDVAADAYKTLKIYSYDFGDLKVDGKNFYIDGYVCPFFYCVKASMNTRNSWLRNHQRILKTDVYRLYPDTDSQIYAIEADVITHSYPCGYGRVYRRASVYGGPLRHQLSDKLSLRAKKIILPYLATVIYENADKAWLPHRIDCDILYIETQSEHYSRVGSNEDCLHHLMQCPKILDLVDPERHQINEIRMLYVFICDRASMQFDFSEVPNLDKISVYGPDVFGRLHSIYDNPPCPYDFTYGEIEKGEALVVECVYAGTERQPYTFNGVELCFTPLDIAT